VPAIIIEPVPAVTLAGIPATAGGLVPPAGVAPPDGVAPVAGVVALVPAIPIGGGGVEPTPAVGSAPVPAGVMPIVPVPSEEPQATPLHNAHTTNPEKNSFVIIVSRLD